MEIKENSVDDIIKLIHCRFCAEPKDNSQVIDIIKDLQVLKQYSEIIECLKIHYIDVLQSSLLPTTICRQCCDKLHDVYTFLRNIKDSQVRLYNLYYKPERQDDIKIKNEISDDDTDYCEGNNTNLNKERNLSKISKSKTKRRMIEEINAINNNAYSFINDSIIQSEQLTCVSDNNIDVKCVKTSGDVKLETDISTTDNKLRNSADGWSTYLWQCHHCGLILQDMDAVRSHTKEAHNKCFGFHCGDCDEPFDMFNMFVEHVRQHRSYLKYFCQYCNSRFATASSCFSHSLCHWRENPNICAYCGQQCGTVKALEHHRNAYRRYAIPKRKGLAKRQPNVVSGKGSWDDYKWTCLECFEHMSNVNSLREHVQQVHGKCFAMKCMDCLKVPRNYRFFVNHVTKHRPYLRKYCQYCNTYFDSSKDLNKHISEHLTGLRRPCHGCGQIFANNSLLSIHMKQYNAPRLKSDLTIEDLTCDVCSKLFKNLNGLKNHRKIHDEKRSKEHVCHSCGKAFFNSNTLLQHVKNHNDVKKDVCKICNEAFNTKAKLKVHVGTHLNLRRFICDYCNANFKTKAVLKSHILLKHMNIKKWKCEQCGRQFKFLNYYKSHMLRHKGFVPTKVCEVCNKRFTNWANCNKHMLREHGMTLAKTKITDIGKVTIDRRTGRPKVFEADPEWLSEFMKPIKKG